METIKNIKLSERVFNVLTDKSSLKFNYQNEPDRYVIDISSMNLLCATRIAILASTYCFINNFKKKLCWLVADDEIRRAISILRLKNVEGIVKTLEQKPSLECAS